MLGNIMVRYKEVRVDGPAEIELERGDVGGLTSDRQVLSGPRHLSVPKGDTAVVFCDWDIGTKAAGKRSEPELPPAVVSGGHLK